MLHKLYSKIILKYPIWVLSIVFICLGYISSFVTQLHIDASSQTLILENDKDLLYSKEIGGNYNTANFLVIAFTPKNDLLSKETLTSISQMSQKLKELPMVDSITSILNVPLLQASSGSVKDLISNLPTLQKSYVDKQQAKKEFLNSPLYANNLVSSDFKTTALMVNLKEQNLSSDKLREKEHQNIQQIRTIMSEHQSDGELFLGGVSMIADDMISYVRSDLFTYGTIIVLILIAVLWLVFRQVRFVLLPMLIITLSVLTTSGLLGMFGWDVTVISSNFIALQIIITMSLIIHLIVRYRELLILYPHASHDRVILDTVLSMFKPCLFAIITTIAGFSSLILSNILPVINLGWMMSGGIALSLLITFIVFPAVMVKLTKQKPSTFFETKFSLIKFYADIAQKYGNSVIVASLLLLVFSVSGAMKLRVENSFIDYFKSSTPIYQGMQIIDQKLGGTTPLDVIYDIQTGDITVDASQTGVDDEFDLFEDEFAQSEDDAQYWFTSQKLKTIEKIHDYLDGLDEVGNVQSLATILKVGRMINDGDDLDNFELALLYKELPTQFKKTLFDPYLNIEKNQVRFSTRIIDSKEGLRRNILIKQIKQDLITKLELKESNIHLTNLMILYNNMLQSLFDSQILTLGIVVLALFVMFFILFASLQIALIAMIANIIPIGTVFGLMGWADIPLDMMTITIAAISIGMGVDNTIHYIHRYIHEFKHDGDYDATLRRSHESIGYAMYYTTATIMIGFSVLVLSNFIPTIYFGLLTVFVVFMALTADLLLLPRLIVVLKPFGRDKNV